MHCFDTSGKAFGKFRYFFYGARVNAMCLQFFPRPAGRNDGESILLQYACESHDAGLIGYGEEGETGHRSHSMPQVPRVGSPWYTASTSFGVMQESRGITLIEILLAVGILAILVSIILIAINPGVHVSIMRDVQRREDVESMLGAVLQYAVDHDGELPPGIPLGEKKEVCQFREEQCEGISLDILVNENYLKKIPVDPSWEGESGTHYFMMRATDGEITVFAPGAEGAERIEVTR